MRTHDWLNEDLFLKVIKYARRLKLLRCNSVDTEDIEQELFCELLKNMKSFDKTKGNISAFAEHILSKRYKNYLRDNFTLKRAGAMSLESIEYREEIGKIIADPMDNLEERIILQLDIARSISRLPIFHMQVCNLLKSHSVSEIAGLLKRPYASLHFEIKKMRRELKEILEGSQKKYGNGEYTYLKGNSMKNISILETLSAKEISALATADLMDLNDQITNLNNQVKEMKQKLDDGLNLRFSETAKDNLRSEGKDTGTARFMDGGFQIIAETPKKVTWDSEKMEAIAMHIPEEKRRDLIKITYAVDERKYLSLPPEWQVVFKEARTVTPGKTRYQITTGDQP